MSGGEDQRLVELEDQNSWKFKDEFWFKVTFIYRTASRQEDEAREKDSDAAIEEKVNDSDTANPEKEKDSYTSEVVVEAGERHGDLEGDSSSKGVYLAGDFNGWSTTKHRMQPCPEGYSVTIPLSEGFYHYKFHAFGEWVRDHHNPHRGGCYDNSIMFVHMDPGVYGLRAQHPPHRDYHRPRADGRQFQVLCPEVPEDISSLGVLQRLVFVYLPPSYFSDESKRYSVVYAHDGQNVFSTPEHMGAPCRGGWYLDAKLDHFWGEGELPEFILVAVPNSDFVCVGNRTREYCTPEFTDTSSDPYIRYLTEVVMKEIDDKYRTIADAEHTVTLGASMGGLCAFVLALARPDVFARAVCMSPSFWYADRNNDSAYSLVERSSESDQPPLSKVYIDSGNGQGDNMYETEMMRYTLEKCGWRKGVEFEYDLDECADRVDLGITHSESVWRERVHKGLKFVLN